MALVSMFLCNQSYASHGRDFLLGATILNFNEDNKNVFALYTSPRSFAIFALDGPLQIFKA